MLVTGVWVDLVVPGELDTVSIQAGDRLIGKTKVTQGFIRYHQNRGVSQFDNAIAKSGTAGLADKCHVLPLGRSGNCFGHTKEHLVFELAQKHRFRHNEHLPQLGRFMA